MDDQLDPRLFKAERDYLRQRMREAQDEYAKHSAGLGLAPEGASPEQVEALRDYFIAVLTQAGNIDLADKWDAAWRHSEATRGRCDELNANNQLKGIGVNDADVRVWFEAVEEMNAASEQFERVNSEAAAWLDKHGGGAI